MRRCAGVFLMSISIYECVSVCVRTHNNNAMMLFLLFFILFRKQLIFGIEIVGIIIWRKMKLIQSSQSYFIPFKHCIESNRIEVYQIEQNKTNLFEFN